VSCKEGFDDNLLVYGLNLCLNQRDLALSWQVIDLSRLARQL